MKKTNERAEKGIVSRDSSLPGPRKLKRRFSTRFLLTRHRKGLLVFSEVDWKRWSPPRVRRTCPHSLATTMLLVLPIEHASTNQSMRCKRLASGSQCPGSGQCPVPVQKRARVKYPTHARAYLHPSSLSPSIHGRGADRQFCSSRRHILVRTHPFLHARINVRALHSDPGIKAHYEAQSLDIQTGVEIVSLSTAQAYFLFLPSHTTSCIIPQHIVGSMRFSYDFLSENLTQEEGQDKASTRLTTHVVHHRRKTAVRWKREER